MKSSITIQQVAVPAAPAVTEYVPEGSNLICI